MFEGESFFEGRSLSEVCGPRYYEFASWFDYRVEPNTPEASIIERYDGTGWFVSEHGPYPATAFEVRFRGHKKILGLGFGHLGGWSSAYEAEEIISLTPIESTYCDITRATL